MMLLAVIFFGFPHISMSATSTSNVEKIVVQAEVAGKALNSATVYRGKGKPVKPDKQLQSAISKLSAARSEVNKLPSSKRTTYNKRLESVSISISRGKIFIDSIKKGEAIAARKKVLDEKSKYLKDVEKAYNALTLELKDVSKFEKVYGSVTRNNLKTYYISPAKKSLQKFQPAIETNAAILKLNKLITAGSSGSTLAVPYKVMMIKIEGVQQSSLKKELVVLRASMEKRISDKVKTGTLAKLLELESDFKLLDANIKPQKSSEVVPDLYKNINSTVISSLFTVQEQAVLNNKLNRIMERLKIGKKELKELLTQKAISKGIPPEIVKGIVLTENGNLQQFNANGDVFKSKDNGYGIMQVTPLSDTDTSFDWNLVKFDLRANLDAGLSVLLEKWKLSGTKIPTINDQNSKVLENWYFALWAYNGLSNYNDPTNPNVHKQVYQSKVYNNILSSVGVKPYVLHSELKVVNQNGWPSFASKMKYVTPYQTLSTQMYSKDDVIVLKKNNVRFRSAPSTAGKYTELSAGTKVQVIKREEDATTANFFSWYLVKLPSGKQGWIASVSFY